MPAGEPICKPAPLDNVKVPLPLTMLVPMTRVEPLLTVKLMLFTVPPEV